MKSEFGPVSAIPSAPPSKTWTSTISQMLRIPSVTAFGITESTVVSSGQVEPAAAVGAQVLTTEMGMSCTVADG
jgi:hypothetical protein